jgi:hypothetical protein
MSLRFDPILNIPRQSIGLRLSVTVSGDGTATLNFTDSVTRTEGTYQFWYEGSFEEEVDYDSGTWTFTKTIGEPGVEKTFQVRYYDSNPVLVASSNIVTKAFNLPVTGLAITSAVDQGGGTLFDLELSWTNPAGYTDVYGTVEVLVNDLTVSGPTAQSLNAETLTLEGLPGSPMDSVDVIVIVTGTTSASGTASSEATDSATVAADDPFPAASSYATFIADESGYTDGQTVTAFPDLSPNNRDLTVTGGTVTYVANQLNGKGVIRYANGSASECASFFNSTIAGNGCFIAVWRFLVAGDPFFDNSTTLWLKNATVSPPGVQKHSYGYKLFDLANLNDGWHYLQYFADTSGDSEVYPYGVGNSFDQLSINFRDVDGSGGTAFAGSGNGITLPVNGSLEIAEMVWLDRRPTWTEMLKKHRILADKYGIYNAVDDSDGVVITMGNSTTSALPHPLAAELLSENLLLFNLALSGATIANMEQIQIQTLELISYFRDLGKPVVVYLHFWHNDNFGSAGINHISGVGSTLFADIRATGAKILLCTSSAWNQDSGRESGRTTLNTWIRDHAVQDDYVDAIYDLGATEEFGLYSSSYASPDTGSSLDLHPTLWQDVVHQTVAGEERKAELVAPAIIAMFP